MVLICIFLGRSLGKCLNQTNYQKISLPSVNPRPVDYSKCWGNQRQELTSVQCCVHRFVAVALSRYCITPLSSASSTMRCCALHHSTLLWRTLQTKQPLQTSHSNPSQLAECHATTNSPTVSGEDCKPLEGIAATVAPWQETIASR